MGGVSPVPSLLNLSLETIAVEIEHVESLVGVPEELVLAIFSRVLQLGKLNPKVLRLFKATDHDQLHALLQGMNIRDPPPLVPSSRNRWLGQNPSWY